MNETFSSHRLLADQRMGEERPAEAIVHYRRALELTPGHPEVVHNLAIALFTTGEAAEAVELLRHLLRENPDHGDGLYNLGSILYQQGAVSESVSWLRRAVERQADPSKALSNLGAALRDLGRWEEAEACYRQVLERQPGYPGALYNLGVLDLQRQRWQRGWQGYEYRRRLPHWGVPPCCRSLAPWRKEPLAGSTLLLWGEQGMGDILQFIRYWPLLRQSFPQARLIYRCPLSLLQLLTPWAERHGILLELESEAASSADYHLPLLSLPWYLGGLTPEAGAVPPYLAADPERVAAWRGRLSRVPWPRVGLVWAGSAAHPQNRQRNLPPSGLEPLLALPGLQWVSLQKGEAPPPPSPHPNALWHDWRNELDDFADTAALISALDLVIAVDTAVVHLTGALGKPVWLLNRFDSDWRWPRSGRGSAWYPTLRLFRQPLPGAWLPLIEQVVVALQGWQAQAQSHGVVQPLEVGPSVAELQRSGDAHRARGEWAAAESCYRQLLAHSPDSLNALFGLGLACQRDGRLDEGRRHLERVVEQAPEQSEPLCQLGLLYQSQGERQRARTTLERLVALDPTHLRGWHALAQLHQTAQRLEEAIACFHAALAHHPQEVALCNNLAVAYQGIRAFAEAEAWFQRVLALAPEDGTICYNLAVLYMQWHNDKAAEQWLRRSIAHQPDGAEAWNRLGSLYKKRGDYQRAEESFSRAITLQPENPTYRCNLGLSHLRSGRVDEAVHLFRETLAHHPQVNAVGRGLALSLLYLPDLTPEQRHQQRCAIVQGWGRVETPFSISPRQRQQTEPRRIGLISSDFRAHPVARNILPLLEAHDPQQWELHCYAESLHPDALTDRFRALARVWHESNGLSDWQLAEQIHRDEIDIAVYLAGHFDANRCEVSRFRPAPVQVSFHDAASSGLVEMDYFFTDRTLHPLGCREPFTEKLYFLPTFYLYGPLAEAPPVQERRGKHPLTLASFNNPKKINPSVIAVWSQILAALPAARLVLKYQNSYGYSHLPERWRQMFQSHGIDPARVEFASGNESLKEHLARYNGVDIALDTFPFTGATTTFQALWMGTPVVTLAGDGFVQRMGASLLIHGGVPELVAASVGEYVEKVVMLAGDGARRRELRQRLRGMVQASPLCDVKGYVRSVEEAYRQMWQERQEKKES